jgi:hypothetical protein
MPKEEFFSKSAVIHNNKYDYSNSIYTSYQEKIKIICPIHGEFNQTPARHISGAGCKKCAISLTAHKKTKTMDDFKKQATKIHKNKYSYDKSVYIANDIPLIITCKKHGDFLKQPNSHLCARQGCPRCKGSRWENDIEDWLIKNDITSIRQAMFIDCIGVGGRRLRFDFFIPDFNTCIEFDGPQHYEKKYYILIGNEKNYEKAIANDKIKNSYCSNKGINLIRIMYNERKRLNKVLTARLSPYLQKAS